MHDRPALNAERHTDALQREVDGQQGDEADQYPGGGLGLVALAVGLGDDLVADDEQHGTGADQPADRLYQTGEQGHAEGHGAAVAQRQQGHAPDEQGQREERSIRKLRPGASPVGSS